MPTVSRREVLRLRLREGREKREREKKLDLKLSEETRDADSRAVLET